VAVIRSEYAATNSNFLSNVLRQNERQLVNVWVTHQLAAKTRRADLMKEDDLRRESTEFFAVFRQAIESGEIEEIDRPAWALAREMLADSHAPAPARDSRHRKPPPSSCR
jgi:hypothetical protein